MIDTSNIARAIVASNTPTADASRVIGAVVAAVEATSGIVVAYSLLQTFANVLAETIATRNPAEPDHTVTEI